MCHVTVQTYQSIVLVEIGGDTSREITRCLSSNSQIRPDRKDCSKGMRWMLRKPGELTSTAHVLVGI